MANIALNGERLYVNPLKSETREGCLLSLHLFKIVLEVLVRVIRQEKEIKDPQIAEGDTRGRRYWDICICKDAK